MGQAGQSQEKGEGLESMGTINSSDDEQGSAGRWTDRDTLTILQWFLGSDNVGRYKAFMKSPTHYFKKDCSTPTFGDSILITRSYPVC